MEIKGKVKTILEPTSGESAKGKWEKHQFVIEFGDKYPKILCVECWEASQVANLKQGDEVTCQIDVESREYQERYYTSARAWKIEISSMTPRTEDDDLPF